MYKIINKKKLFATMVADLIGNAICFPRMLFRKNEEIRPEEIKEILVIRTAYIGDVVMTLPVLKPLKELYPGSRITFLTGLKAKEILENNPYIDETIAYNAFWFYPRPVTEAVKEYLRFLKVLRAKRYDLVIEARGDIRELLFIVFPLKARFKVSYDVGGGGYFLTHVVPYKMLKHRVEYHLDIVRYLGCSVEDIEWGIYLKRDEEVRVDELFAKAGINNDMPLTVIHPGARKRLKCWSPEGYAALADALIDRHNISLVFTGSPDEVELVQKVLEMMKHSAAMLAGNITLREMAGILKRCNLFICNDSAPLHIASAMKTPTVAIFGPSKSIETGPYGNIHRVVEKDFPCRYTCDEDVCNYTVHNECMKTITPDDVYEAANYILKQKLQGKELIYSET